MVVLSYILMTILLILGLFLIGLILLQRGRGGGLAGAFGGMGGQSAFGTKAGDVFTRITIGVGIAWILLCGMGNVVLHRAESGRSSDALFKKDEPKGKADEIPRAPAKEDEIVLPGAETSEKPLDSEKKEEVGTKPEASKEEVKSEPVKEEPKAETPAADTKSNETSEKKDGATGEEKKPTEPPKNPEAAPAEEKPAEKSATETKPPEEKKP